jgi:hypothetical protein
LSSVLSLGVGFFIERFSSVCLDKEIKRYISREVDLGGAPEEPPEPVVVHGADNWEVECVL